MTRAIPLCYLYALHVPPPQRHAHSIPFTLMPHPYRQSACVLRTGSAMTPPATAPIGSYSRQDPWPGKVECSRSTDSAASLHPC